MWERLIKNACPVQIQRQERGRDRGGEGRQGGVRWKAAELPVRRTCLNTAEEWVERRRRRKLEVFVFAVLSGLRTRAADGSKRGWVRVWPRAGFGGLRLGQSRHCNGNRAAFQMWAALSLRFVLTPCFCTCSCLLPWFAFTPTLDNYSIIGQHQAFMYTELKKCNGF